MNRPIKFGITFVITLILCLFVTVTLTGWSTTMIALGGFLSLTGMLVLLLAGALSLGVVFYLQDKNYKGNTGRMAGEAVVAVVVIGGLTWLGIKSVSLPNGGSLRVLFALLFILAASAGITWLDSRK